MILNTIFNLTIAFLNRTNTHENTPWCSGYCSKSTTKDLAVTIIYNFRGIFIVLTIHSSDFKVRLLTVVRFKLINCSCMDNSDESEPS